MALEMKPVGEIEDRFFLPLVIANGLIFASRSTASNPWSRRSRSRAASRCGNSRSVTAMRLAVAENVLYFATAQEG